MASTPEPVYTVEQVATLSGRTPGAIRKAAERRKIPGIVRLGPRILRFRADEIRRWLRDGSVRRGKGRASA